MILETPILPFELWLRTNGPICAIILGRTLVLGLFVGFLAAALRHGPVLGLGSALRTLVSGLRELGQTSPRRVVTLARLAFQEAIRSKVLVAFALFVLVLLLAGWFLDSKSEDPGQLYLSFVLQVTNYLVLILAIFLSAFSLPNDIKRRTIYTIVTKPVRVWEIVFGRMLGFVAVGTLLLALMWLCSYVFVVTGLRHQHQVELASVATSDRTVHGDTTMGRYHRHQFQLGGDGRGSTDVQQGHWHEAWREGDEANAAYATGPARDQLKARVPLMGGIRFLDSKGRPGEGVSVGKMWRYRDYIEGGSDAAAIWRFTGLSSADFPRELPLEMTIRVFRTFIGQIDRGILGQLVLVNPTNDTQSSPIEFTAQEVTPLSITIPRELEGVKRGVVSRLDLHEDLIADGQLDIKIQCMEPAQYFGMAQADLYVRAADRPFWLNFFKGYVGIWFQLVVVVAFGVMFSTMLSGPVSMLATIATVVTGFFAKFIVLVATGEHEGGGPGESMVRMFKQLNLVTELDGSLSTSMLRGFDSVVMRAMTWVARILPDYGGFSTTHFVAYGYSVPGNLIAQHLCVTVTYVVVLSFAAYYLLRSREIAA